MTILNEGNSHSNHNGHSIEGFVNDEIATSPNMPELIPRLLENISISKDTFKADNPAHRLELLDAARSLVYALESPREAMLRFSWSQSTTRAAINTAVDLGLFATLSRDDKPHTADELARSSGGERKLVARILKHLSAMGVILETESDEYRRTGLSTALCSQQYLEFYRCASSRIATTVLALPEHLKNTGYRNPSNSKDCAFQLGNKTESHFFDFLASNPEIAGRFHNNMTTYSQGRLSWVDANLYDVTRLIEGVDIGNNDVMLVDMGGGQGQDISAFRRQLPNAPGRLILQDLPGAIAKAKTKGLHPSIEMMEHDFFTEQSIKGARAYFMHFILHDWTDEDSLKILKALTPAMKHGRSKLLINEHVIPETKAYWESTSLDLIMMASLGGIERTAADWHALLESAGLKIVNIWNTQRGVESLIECELL